MAQHAVLTPLTRIPTQTHTSIRGSVDIINKPCPQSLLSQTMLSICKGVKVENMAFIIRHDRKTVSSLGCKVKKIGVSIRMRSDRIITPKYLNGLSRKSRWLSS